MRFVFIILILLPILSISQTQYYNLDFEETDSVNKNILTWNRRYVKSNVLVLQREKISISGENCLLVSNKDYIYYDGCTIYATLPHELLSGLQSVRVSVDILYPNEKPHGGFFVLATKGNGYLGKASTYFGELEFPIVLGEYWQLKEKNVIANKWYNYEMMFELNEKPDDIMIGIYVGLLYLYVDNIKIYLNDIEVTNLVFSEL